MTEYRTTRRRFLGMSVAGAAAVLAPGAKALATTATSGPADTVWYYRENPAADPPPNAMAVLDLVMRSRVPISMSSRPDFSDYIDENGSAHEREP